MASGTMEKPSADESPYRDSSGEGQLNYSDGEDPSIPLKSFHEGEGEDDDAEDGKLLDPERFALDGEQPTWYGQRQQKSSKKWMWIGIAAAVILSLLIVVGYFREPIQAKLKSGPRKAVVIASYKRQNVTWIKTIPDDWEVFRYINDDPDAKYTVATKNGREAIAYLTYIIDNYDNMPDYTVFVHGHDQKWHQIEHIVWKMRALNLTALDEYGYFNLRCTQNPGCTEPTVLKMHPPREGGDRRWFAKLMPKWLKWHYQEYDKPPTLAEQCCGQFAASKAAIHARSKQWWIDYRTPLFETGDELREWIHNPGHPTKVKYDVGLPYEKTWHLAFGKEAWNCPSEELCRETFFSNKIKCDKHLGRWKDSQQWDVINCTAVFDGVIYRSGPIAGPNLEYETEYPDDQIDYPDDIDGYPYDGSR